MLFNLFTRALSRIQSSGKYSGGYTFYDLTGKMAHTIFSVYGGGDNIFFKSREGADNSGAGVYQYKHVGI